MAIMATAGGSNGQTFEPAPEGVHQAVLVDVVDLGILQTSWQGVTSSKHKVNLAWQINEDRDDGKPYLVFKRYTLSLHEKSALRKDLESWRGRNISRTEEQAGVDLESMLGKNCLLNITHATVGDRIFANVSSVNPLMKSMKPIAARDYVRKVDRVDPGSHAACDIVSEAQAMAGSLAAGGAWAEHDELNPPPISDDDIAF